MIDLALRRSVVRSATPEKGGYRVTFENCGHVVWFAVHPGPTAHCSACMREFLTEIRQGNGAELITPREFLIAHQPKLAEVQKDAQHMSASAFLRKYGIAPKEYQHRIRKLRLLAARDASGDGEARDTMRILLMTWSRGLS